MLNYDPFNKDEALKRAAEKDKYPLGIFYENDDKKTFEDTLKVYTDDELPLYEREVNMQKLEDLIESRRRL
jgi:2-oxoglutarate/2-oxoacid ferredoxin oxidoreductase subunit beta